MVEVKSITDGAHQVRLGLGQVLDDAASLESAGHDVVPVVALSGPVAVRRWEAVFARAGVCLASPLRFAELVREA